ncbi:MAG: hypothetical protein WC297_00005, partial [Candidatus Paceibacterota bacterium]
MEKKDEEKITILAETNFRNEKRKFGIKRRDRRYHMYIVGKTGVGKSTLISNMVISDLVSSEGLALLDPHGDLVGRILENLPPDRAKDLIYLNPQNGEEALYFNPLEVNNPSEGFLVVSALISVFKKIGL